MSGDPQDPPLISHASALSIAESRFEVASAGDRLTETLPRWEIRGELGVGGMGRVLLAHDRMLKREVAIKEPRTKRDTARLRHEAAIAARLEHPGVLPVYDVGLSPQGQPWFVMRLVRGTSLRDALRATPDLAGRMRLLRPLQTVCETLAYAHDRGVIHRDVKPSNIMLGAFGETTVIDWGLATLGPDDRSGGEDATRSPDGTARYMSPEQAKRLTPHPTDDVFSLGLILLECLSGHAAYRDTDPARVIDGLRGGAGPDQTDLPNEVPPALCAIVARATARDRTERYSDAKALADDLDRFLQGALVSAHTYTPTELFRRLVFAWRAPIAVAVVAICIMIALVWVGVGEIRDERDIASASLAMALTTSAERELGREARDAAEILASHAYARDPRPETRGVLAQLPERRPRITRHGALPCTARALHGDRLLCSTPEGIMLMEGPRELWRVAHAPGAHMAFIADGTLLVTLTRAAMRVFDAKTGAPHRDPIEPVTVAALLPAADGASATVTTPDVVWIVDQTGESEVRAGCGPTGFMAFALHPDGRRWAASCRDGALIRGTRGDPEVIRITGPVAERFQHVTALAFHSGGAELLLGTVQGLVMTRRLDDGEVALIASADGLIHALTIDAAGGRAIVHSDQGAPVVIDLAARAALGRLPRGIAAHRANGRITVAGERLETWDFTDVLPRAVRFAAGISTISGSADGAVLAVAHGPHLTLLDTATRAHVATRTWPGWMVKDAAFTPDGGALVGYGFGDPSLITMAVAGGLEEISRLPARASVRRVAVLTDGAIIASTNRLGTRLRPAGGPGGGDGEPLLATSARDLVVTPDGRHVAALGEDRGIYLMRDLKEMRDRELKPTPCAHVAGAAAIAIDPSATSVFVIKADQVLVRCGTGDGLSAYDAPGADLLAVAASPRWVAAGGRDGGVWLWRRGSAAPHVVARPHDARVSAVIIAPDETWVASSAWDGRVAFTALREHSYPSAAQVEEAWGRALPSVIGQSLRRAPLQ